MANRKKKVYLIAGGVILAVIVLSILALLVGPNALKPRIEASASSALGMDVRVRGRVSFSFFPIISASLADTSVKSAGAEVAVITRMKIGLKLLPFITGRVRISRLELIEPAVSLVRQKDGKLNIEKQGGEPSGNRMDWEKLAISRGSLRFTDLKTGGGIVLEGVDITVGNLSARGRAGGDPLKTLSFTGDIRCRTITAGDFTLTDLVMRVAGRNGVFDIDEARMNVFGGAGSGTLHGDFTGTEPQFKIVYALNRLKIEDLLQESPNAKNLEGLADLSAGLTAKGRTAIDVKRSLSGQVSLSGENIVLNSVDIDALISSRMRSQRFNLVDVGAFFLAGPLGPVLTRGYKFGDLYSDSRTGTGVIAKLVSVWKIGNGVAEAVDVAMATKKHRLAMTGGLNFIDNRFEDAVVAVLDQGGCAVFVQKVRGPFSSPEVGKISALKSLTRPVTNLVRSAVKLFDRRDCVVFYSGSVGPPEDNKRP